MIDLEDEQRILLDSVKRAVKEKVAPTAAERDKKGTFDWDIASLFWDLGLLQITLPEAYGGLTKNPTSTF